MSVIQSTKRAVRAVPDPKAAAIELTTMVLLIEAIMWIVPLIQDLRVMRTAYMGLAAMVLVLLITCVFLDHSAPESLGIRFDNFFRTLRALALPLAVFIVSVLVIGYLAGSIRLGPRFYSMLLFVPVWAFLQQYMLLAFAGRRLRLILGEGRPSVIATAALFAFLHLPNPALTVACAMGGYIWASVYEKEPNLFANSISHGIASAFLANTLPHWILANMVVGYNHFFR